MFAALRAPAALSGTLLDQYVSPEVRVQAKPINAPSVRVIGAEEARAVPGTAGDPLRAVSALPGVAPASDADSNLYVRGGGPNDNALYADGIPAGYPYHFQGVASSFPGDAVKTLTFYSGGFPARFGDRMGGIFDLKTRDAAGGRLAGALDASAIATSAAVESPLGAPGVAGVAVLRKGYFDFVLPRRITDVAVPRYDDELAKATWTTGAGVWRAEVMAARDDAAAEVRPAGAAGPAGRYTWEHAFRVGALSWEGSLGAWRTVAVLAAHDAVTGVDLAGDYFYETRPAETYGRAEIRRDLGAHRLEAGAEGAATRNRLDAYFARLPSEGQGAYVFAGETKLRVSEAVTARRQGLWAADRWSPAAGTEVEAGGRVDEYALSGVRVASPRLAASQALGRRVKLLAAFGLYRQAPQPEEVMPVWGNSALQPARSWHAVGGIEGSWGAWNASLEGWVKTFDGLVVPDATAHYANAGTGRARGIELLLRRPFSEQFAGWLAYTGSVSRRTDGFGTTERPSDYDVPHALSVVGRALVTPAWTLSARWRLASGTPYTKVLGTTRDAAGNAFPAFGPVNGARLPAYARLDVRAEYRMAFEGFTVEPYVELLNATDHENLAVMVWSANYAGERRVTQLPRTTFAGARVTF